ncbi:MAG: cupin domain-containing protein [Candidatus Electrothrix sp. LOE1_4_5]|nr:cupin domain-containing protein [Candidatus Electrothrix gigas]MCI5225704.1 cupin domain-containing protein [Candidatus Electrothrix gigas]
MKKHIFTDLPVDLKNEQVDEILQAENIRIERIVSKGHTSPTTGWYDQEENEWVLVLQGAGTILFAEDNQRVTLQQGDFFHIPAHAKHKVVWTDPEEFTVWLAMYYSVEDLSASE